jgi:WD40 repeat protein
MSSSANSGGQSQILSPDNTTAATTAPLPLTPDLNDNNNSERLKQQTQRLTHHSNGVTSPSSATSNTNLSSSSNGHEGNSSNGNNNNNHPRNRFISASTQTILTSSSYPSNNGNTNTSRIFTNSQKEVLRLIGQHLQSVGLNKTVDILIHESGCVLEHEQASNFRELIMSGKWSESLIALEKLKQYIEERDGIQQMKYLILEQKYFELIEDNHPMDALQCLRNEIQGLKIRTERTHELTTFLMFNSMKDMYKAANWSGKGFASRQNLMEKLQKYLPPDIMLPPKRLESLLSQAVELQQERCTYHVKPGKLTLDDVSLLKDHACTKQTFPCVTIQTLTEHSDEVWFCKFSPDGTKLATGSKDGYLHVYDVDMQTYKMKLRKQFEGHSFGIGCIAWCPFSRYIIACGTDECNELWIWDVEQEEQRSRMNHTSEDSLTCAAWLPCGQRFVCGGSRGQFYYCDIEGNVIDSWEGVRLQCLHVTNDGIILAADAQKRISSYKFDSLTDQQIIHEDHPIMSFTVSKDGRLALLNIATQGVHLWDLHDKQLVRKYQGVTQGHYVNHATFGGPNEEFIASGSEDSKVYLWHRRQERPIMVFSGHTRTVNCVSWHPTLPLLFASASDDATVRIWSTPEHQMKTESLSSNESSS